MQVWHADTVESAEFNVGFQVGGVWQAGGEHLCVYVWGGVSGGPPVSACLV